MWWTTAAQRRQATSCVVVQACKDPRVTVIRHSQNQGVGGAMVIGYQRAVADGAGVIVKLDGDGQMDPTLLMSFAMPIILGEADYTKGNRFFDLRHIGQMPTGKSQRHPNSFLTWT